jgi:hypothetical protein
MMPKLQRIVREIERANEKIAELQELLPELEKQKTELENTEIVRLVRSASVAPGELEAFLRTVKAGNTAPPASQTNNYNEEAFDNDEA